MVQYTIINVNIPFNQDYLSVSDIDALCGFDF